MPTPFTHLAAAQRLLRDEALSESFRLDLYEERAAFLLGNVAADARVGAAMPRERTHFYIYGQDITDHPWRVMLQLNPDLLRPRDESQRAFVAGYVAHLAMDEYWSLNMVVPHFVGREWGSRVQRFLMLHIILIHMDERDLLMLEPWQANALGSAKPYHWLSFLSDRDLIEWQRIIHDQIIPGGESETLDIFGVRVGLTPPQLRAILDAPDRMQADLWDHIPQATLAEVEQGMYIFAREQMQTYLEESTLSREI